MRAGCAGDHNLREPVADGGVAVWWRSRTVTTQIVKASMIITDTLVRWSWTLDWAKPNLLDRRFACVVAGHVLRGAASNCRRPHRADEVEPDAVPEYFADQVGGQLTLRRNIRSGGSFIIGRRANGSLVHVLVWDLLPSARLVEQPPHLIRQRGPACSAITHPTRLGIWLISTAT